MSSLQKVVHSRCAQHHPPTILLKTPIQKGQQGRQSEALAQKDDNRDYFRGQDNVLRVQHWREAHPRYWRRSKQSSHALQDPLTSKLL